MKKVDDVIGLKFGRWTVIQDGLIANKKQAYLCICECGIERLVGHYTLKNGSSKSCGCLSRENTRGRLTTHGMTKTPLFNVWKGILSRCNNNKTKAWKDYGARGIKVSESWSDFINFYNDMGSSYAPGLTIERKNNEVGYTKENCIWIPKSEQSKNRRNNRYIITNKGVMTITEACQESGVSWYAMRARYEKNWPIEDMLLPPGSRSKNAKNKLSECLE